MKMKPLATEQRKVLKKPPKPALFDCLYNN